MAKRTKSGKILIRVGTDAVRRANRLKQIAAEKAASNARRSAKKAATALRRSMRRAALTNTQIARRLARARATQARREAKRQRDRETQEEYNRRQRDPNRPRRPVHPKGPYATEKYTSYARRLERSKRLKATRASPTTFTCNGYTIKVTAGVNPKALSCTCPDFTQVQGGREWVGTNAGPFNPCKHMMAVEGERWKCSNGVCRRHPSGSYGSEEECIAALVSNENLTYTIQGYLKRNSTAFGNETFGYFNDPNDSPVPLSRNFPPLSIGPGYNGNTFIPNGFGGGRIAFYNRDGIERSSQGDISGGLLEDMTFTLVLIDPPRTCPA